MNLTDQIAAPSSGVPIGTVINWPYSWNPDDAENWRECNGQSLAGTALCKQKGQCVAPDFQGRFLRGYGGQSGKLGEVQSESVYLPESAGTTMEIKGITTGMYTYTDTVPYSHDKDAAGFDWEDRTAGFMPYEEAKKQSWGWANSGRTRYTLSNNGIGVGSGMEVQIGIKSDAKETRPTNTAVRYLIKVN